MPRERAICWMSCAASRVLRAFPACTRQMNLKCEREYPQPNSKPGTRGRTRALATACQDAREYSDSLAPALARCAAAANSGGGLRWGGGNRGGPMEGLRRGANDDWPSRTSAG